MGGAHIEQRPSWLCRGCGDPWPCETVRRELSAAIEPATLRASMWMRLEVAAEDLRGVPPAELFRRFLRWA